jgi:hypothetical protein
MLIPLVLILLLLNMFSSIFPALWILRLSSTLMGMLSLQQLRAFFVIAISDADWALDETDQQSISGYCFFFINSLVSWLAVKQKSVSLSSTEAKYYLMTHAIKEALWLYLFLTLLSFPVPRPFSLLSDNQSACSLANNSTITPRSKHIDVCYHFIQDHISDGTFSTH